MEKELENAILKIVEISHALIEENGRLKKDIENLRLRFLDGTEKAVQELSEIRNPSISDVLELKLPKPRKNCKSAEKDEPHFYWQSIPARARKVLRYYKIKGPAGLENLTVRQIKKSGNAGAVTIEVIRQLGLKYGIELKDR